MLRINKKRAAFVSFVAVWFASILIQMAIPIASFVAKAAPQNETPVTSPKIEWVSINNLKYDGKDYAYTTSVQSITQNTSLIGAATLGDKIAVFTEEGKTGCYNGYVILVDGNNVTVKLQELGTATGTSGTCTQRNYAVPTSPINPSLRYTNLLWQDVNTIVRIDSKKDSYDNEADNLGAVTYKREGTTNNFSEAGSSCGDIMTFSADMSHPNYIVQSIKKNDKQDITYDGSGNLIQDISDTAITGTSPPCFKSSSPIVVNVAFASVATAPEGAGRQDDPTGSTTGETDTGDKTLTDSCYSALPLFGWILCGVIDMADALFAEAQGWVFDLLNIPIGTYSEDTGLKNTWAVSRNLANVGLVLVALVMIASQIFSFEFMSAYTIKKVIPRLVAATILIQLSWIIFTAMIAIINAIGFGLYSLLVNAFGATDIIDMLGHAGTFGEEVTANVAGVGIIVGIIGGTVAAGVAIATGGAGLALVFTMVSVIISLVVAIFTLIIRKMLIIILLVISPLALLAWILPGTQNLWNTWWKLFSRLLAMLPLIALLFAAGRIGASIMLESNTDNTLRMILAIIVYFAPLFLIPSTFKFAGGMFTTATKCLTKPVIKARALVRFGGKDRAKLNKDNSAYALNEKARDADKISQKQKGYSETLLEKKGLTGKYLNRKRFGGGMHGVSDTGQSDILARAAAARSQEEKQQMDNARARGNYEVEMLRGSVGTDGLYDYLDIQGRQLDEKENCLQVLLGKN